MIDVAKELKARKARRVFCLSTFGLFTNGLDVFDKAVEEGIIEKVITTNLTYQTPELLERDWYVSSDVSKYVALLIDTLNHNGSISELLTQPSASKNIWKRIIYKLISSIAKGSRLIILSLLPLFIYSSFPAPRRSSPVCCCVAAVVAWVVAWWSPGLWPG